MTKRAAIQTMASGNLSLLITENVNWDSFPIQAQQFLKRVNGKAIKRTKNPAEHIWVVLIRWRPFFLTFEDFPLGMSLDSMSRFGNYIIRDIHQSLEMQ